MRPIPVATSPNLVVSGDSPSLTEFGSAEVGDDPVADQVGGHALGIRVANRDMGAATHRVSRAAEGEAQPGKARVEQRDRVFGQGDALRPDAVDAGVGDEADALLDGRQRDDPGRPDEPCPDSRLGIVSLAHRELVALAEPALDRVSQLPLERVTDVEPGGRTGSAVEVLVGAPHGQVGAGSLEVHLDRAAGVAQVPEAERARVVGQCRDRGHVGDRRRAVVDMTERHQGDVARVSVDGGRDVGRLRTVDRVGVEPGDLEVPLPSESLEQVAVGREVRRRSRRLVGPGLASRAASASL